MKIANKRKSSLLYVLNIQENTRFFFFFFPSFQSIDVLTYISLRNHEKNMLILKSTTLLFFIVDLAHAVISAHLKHDKYVVVIHPETESYPPLFQSDQWISVA